MTFRFFPGKSPMQMRLEAERAKNPPLGPPSGNVDSATRPQITSETPLEIDAAIDWLAPVQAGRIQVR